MTKAFVLAKKCPQACLNQFKKKKKTMLVREERNVDSLIFFLSLSSKEGRESTGKEKVNFSKAI